MTYIAKTGYLIQCENCENTFTFNSSFVGEQLLFDTKTFANITASDHNWQVYRDETNTTHHKCPNCWKLKCAHCDCTYEGSYYDIEINTWTNIRSTPICEACKIQQEETE